MLPIVVESFPALSVDSYLMVCSLSGEKLRAFGNRILGLQVFPTAPIQYLLPDQFCAASLRAFAIPESLSVNVKLIV